MVEKLKYVKLYGERNTGTNFLSGILEYNFIVKQLRGIRPISEKELQVLLDASGLKGFLRILLEEHIIDQDIKSIINSDFGWKHASPHIAQIQESAIQYETLFIVLTKSPYFWLKSLYEKPYHYLSGDIPNSISNFIRQNWLTVKRDNIGNTRLKSPIELWNLKGIGYKKLKQAVSKNFIHIRYEDLLFNFYLTMGKLRCHLLQKHNKWVLPEYDDLNLNKYLDKYKEENIYNIFSKEDLAYINNNLDSDIMKFLGYRYIYK